MCSVEQGAMQYSMEDAFPRAAGATLGAKLFESFAFAD